MGVVLPQNSFFTPIIIPKDNGYYNFSFFSGNGDISSGLCNDNFMHTIEVTTLSHPAPEDTKSFSYWPIKLFYTKNTACSKTAWSNLDVFRASALYDYAAILIPTDGSFYYIIHGGCPCYINMVKSAVVIIKINSNSSFQYIFGSLNIKVA
jgi:hypothetical protein